MPVLKLFFSLPYNILWNVLFLAFFPHRNFPEYKKLFGLQNYQRERITATFLLVQGLRASANSSATKCTVVSQNCIYWAYIIIKKHLTVSNISQRLLPLSKAH